MTKSAKAMKVVNATMAVSKLETDVAKTPKKIEDLRIIDVLVMPIYNETLRVVMGRYSVEHEKHEAKAPYGLKADSFSRLVDRGLWESQQLTVLYAEIIEKKNKSLSATDRQFVSAICNDAFNMTIARLINDEKARNNGNGDDQ